MPSAINLFMQKKIVFLINNSEITAGTRGASLGPEAIITAARKMESPLFGEHEVKRLQNLNYLLDSRTQFMHAKRIDGILQVYKDLNADVSEILNNGDFPFVIAGDHGSAGGTIAGIKSSFPSKRLGVVWIDAHADIHTPYTTPSGNIHGMPLASALAVDNLECQSNDVDEQTVSLWNQLKNVGGISPKISPEDIVYVSVRDIEPEENCIMELLGIRNIPVSELRENGVAKIMTTIETKLAACELIYVSFDVDSMDPILTSYGTGTPVANGLAPEEAKALMIALAQNPKTICMEVVEVNPCLDDKLNKMAETAFDIIETVIKTIKK